MCIPYLLISESLNISRAFRASAVYFCFDNCSPHPHMTMLPADELCMEDITQ